MLPCEMTTTAAEKLGKSTMAENLNPLNTGLCGSYAGLRESDCTGLLSTDFVF
jgi:hypothetical protein